MPTPALSVIAGYTQGGALFAPQGPCWATTKPCLPDLPIHRVRDGEHSYRFRGRQEGKTDRSVHATSMESFLFYYFTGCCFYFCELPQSKGSYHVQTSYFSVDFLVSFLCVFCCWLLLLLTFCFSHLAELRWAHAVKVSHIFVRVRDELGVESSRSETAI